MLQPLSNPAAGACEARPAGPTETLPAEAKIHRVLSIVLILSALVAPGCVAGLHPGEPAPEAPTAPSPQQAAPQRGADPSTGTALPEKDVPGRDPHGLPRFPDSVRVAYEREEHEKLKMVRVRFLSREEPNAVRAFYRGVFASERWRVANVESARGGWVFLAVSGEREAVVAIEPEGRGSEIGIELTEPLRGGGAAGEPAPAAEGKPAPRSAPTPMPDDDYYEGDDGWDDAGEGLDGDDD